MPVIIHSDHIQVFDEFQPCPGCDAEESLYDTGCPVDGHHGYGCPECGWGCDYELVDDEDSQCVAAEEERP
jgi:hypothetical protein